MLRLYYDHEEDFAQISVLDGRGLSTTGPIYYKLRVLPRYKEDAVKMRTFCLCFRCFPHYLFTVVLLGDWGAHGRTWFETPCPTSHRGLRAGALAPLRVRVERP